MVKNRNYQVRVEESAARRKEAKERKKRSDDRRQYKSLAQELLKKLDSLLLPLQLQLQLQQQETLVLHLWTDIPGASVEEEEEEDDTSSKSNRRNRSASVGTSQDAPHNKGRSRSNSVPSEAHVMNSKSNNKGGKKQDRLGNSSSQETSAAPLLCRHHFFKGNCPLSSSSGSNAGRRKSSSSCRYVHYYDDDKKHNNCEERTRQYTLFQAVGQAAAASLPETLQESDPHAMEMLYNHHLTLPVRLSLEEGKVKDNQTSLLSSLVSSLLQEKALHLSSIVYASLGRAMVYDRTRGGWLWPDNDDNHNNKDIHAAVLGGHHHTSTTTTSMMRRKDSIRSEYSQEELESIVRHLPGAVLETILTFLPDAAVASVTRVCTAWNREIGQQSPNLWRQLLARQQWPLPLHDDNDNDNDNTTQLYRTAYRDHYTAVRNLRAIQQGLAVFLQLQQQHTSKKPAINKELSYQDFSSRKGAPAPGNACASVRIWSANRVLAAYEDDCSLRLFETKKNSSTTANSTANNTGLVCRELVCQSMDLTRHTKKLQCRLRNMILDENCIIVLLTQFDLLAENSKSRELLVGTSREAFLCGAAEEEESSSVSTTTTIIDVGDTVLKYLLEHSELLDPNCFRILLDFIEDGGDISDWTVRVSKEFESVGPGLVLFEVSIYGPGGGLLLMDRKLVSLTVESGAILWVGDSLPEYRSDAVVSPDAARISVAAGQSSHETCCCCTVAVCSNSSPSVYVGNSNSPCEKLEWTTVDVSLGYPRDFDRPVAKPNRLVVATSNKILCIDTWVRPRGKTIILFYNSCNVGSGADCETLSLVGELVAFKLTCPDDRHALLLCYDFTPPEQDQERGNNPLDAAEPSAAVCAILVDISSGVEMERETWVPRQKLSACPMWKTMVAAEVGTLAVAFNSRGIIMTGESVRSAGDSRDPLDGSATNFASSPPRSLRKKKKNKAASASKKDGFVRGKRMYF
ncbi:expressed unknown protein [Seminavis robusta]|uniref:F-box domain-containing protein n=1 Tax=Seminavis robusta TaxID=568900 RepID=A0A9N8E6W9_9STRA|nr:expressed unknown protein [Seminavis robusta]|eukprot:Sro577_g169710.1 n/a (969) ;mRNA; r:46469-49375